MFSRAGKSTNTMYLAFQDKNKLDNVISKVSNFIGIDKAVRDEKVSASDALKAMMSPNKSSDMEITNKIFRQGLKAAGLNNQNRQTGSQAQKIAEMNRLAQFE